MMGGETQIVAMEKSHLGDVQRIDRLVYPQPWSNALWRQEVEMTDRRRYRVALCDVDGARDHVAGFSGLMLLAGEGHVSTVAVDPALQRRGLATALMDRLVEEAVAAGVHALTLEVRVSNLPARELYRRFGFAPAGIRPNYYSDTNEDALIMWRHDVSAEIVGSR